MTMVDAVQVSPVPWTVLRGFLLSRTEITDRVGTRVLPRMPGSFPGIRVTEISSRTLPLWSRTHMQLDCWADDQYSADVLGVTVRNLMLALHQYVTSEAVLVAGFNWSAAPMADQSVTLSGGAPQPRSIVTGNVRVRPNL